MTAHDDKEIASLRARLNELEAAVNGQANAIVTFNQKDFGEIPMKFSVEVLAPVDALRRIKS
jgi:hypothetical protein